MLAPGADTSSIKSDRIQKLDAEGVREWRSHEPLGGPGVMLPQKILKTRTLQMLFPAFWSVNFNCDCQNLKKDSKINYLFALLSYVRH